jgi:ABC-2 type transport system ATP-binding protein
MTVLPSALASWSLMLKNDGNDLEYTFDAHAAHGISDLLRRLNELGIGFKDLNTRESSLEDIFVSLVHNGADEPREKAVKSGVAK